MKEKTRPRFRGWWFLVLILFSLGAAFKLIDLYGKQFAIQALNRVLEREIAAHYKVEYQDVLVDVWKHKMQIQHFSLSRDTLPQNDSGKKQYQIFIPTLDIQLESVKSIFLDKILSVKGLSVVHPEIRIINHSKGEKSTITTESSSLLELISRYLNLFTIDFLKIDKAKFAYQKDDLFELADIDFELRQFVLDSTLQRRKFFNAEYIELVVSNEQFLLNDNIHQLTFDKLRLSTQDSILSFENIQLQPKPEIDLRAVDWERTKALYNLSIPTFALKGIDYEKSYMAKAICIDQLQLQEPVFKVRSASVQPPKSSDNNDAVLTILQNFAPAIAINHIQVNNGIFEFRTSKDEKVQLATRMNYLELFNFQIDPYDFYFTLDEPPFYDFKFELEDFEQVLPGGAYRLKAGTIALNSMDSTLNLESATLIPERFRKDSSQSKLHVHIPSFNATKVHFLEALFGKGIRIDSIQLKQPTIALQQGKKVTQPSEKQASIAKLRQVLKQSHLDPISVNHIGILEGQLAIDTLIALEQYHLYFDKVQLNTSLQAWSDIAKQFLFTGMGTTIKSKAFKAQIAFLESNGQNHILNNVAVALQRPDLALEFEAPNIQLKDTELDSLIEGEIQFDSLIVEGGKTDLRLFEKQDTVASTKDSFSLPFTGNLLVLKDNALNLTLAKGERVQIADMDYSITMDGKFKVPNLSLQNIQIEQAANPKQITVDKLEKLDTNAHYIFEDIQFAFDTSYSGIQQFLIPELKVLNFDRERLIKKQELVFGNVELNHPKIVIVQGADIQAPSAETTSGTFPKLWVDSFLLHSVDFSYQQIKHGDTTLFSIPDVDFGVQDVKGLDVTKIVEDSLLMKQSFLLNTLGPVRLQLPNLKIEFSNIRYDSDPNELWIHDLILQNASSRFEQRTELESLRLKDLDLNAFLLEKQLKMELCAVSSLSTTMKIVPRDTTRVAPSGKGLINLGYGLDIKAFELDKASANVQADRPIEIRGLRLQIKELKTDSSLSIQELDQRLETLFFEVEELELPLGEYDEYTLRQKLYYDSELAQLKIDGLQLQPNFTEEAYNQLLEYQNDYFDVQVKNISLYDVPLRKFLEQDWTFSRIDLDGLNAVVSRDKRLPDLAKPRALIQGQIKNINTPFLIDTLYLNGDLSYTEVVDSSGHISFIEFTDIDGSLQHITNKEDQFDQPMTLNAKGKLFDVGPFRTSGTFNLGDSLNTFDWSGKVHKMDLTVLNQLITPLAGIHIHSGKSKQVIFKITGNDHSAIGEMSFKYNKLKFQIINKDAPGKLSFGNALRSFFANRLVKSNNPSFLSKRMGIVYFERDQNKAIFNFWGKSILSGIISSVGARNNRKRLKLMSEEELEKLHYRTLFGEKLRPKKLN